MQMVRVVSNLVVEWGRCPKFIYYLPEFVVVWGSTADFYALFTAHHVPKDQSHRIHSNSCQLPLTFVQQKHHRPRNLRRHPLLSDKHQDRETSFGTSCGIRRAQAANIISCKSAVIYYPTSTELLRLLFRIPYTPKASSLALAPYRRLDATHAADHETRAGFVIESTHHRHQRHGILGRCFLQSIQRSVARDDLLNSKFETFNPCSL